LRPARLRTLMDHRLGFESLGEGDEATNVELDVKGSLPDWLDGVLVRNGPGAYETDGASVNHWFDGMAMLHRFEIDGTDDEVRYTSRFLRTDAHKSFRDGEVALSEFATDPCEGLFGRFFSYFAAPDPTDNANVNVVRTNKDDPTYLALTETPMPVEFDADTLETLGKPEEYGLDELGHVTTAHPHTDPETGVYVNYVTRFGRKSTYRVFEGTGDEKKVVAEREVKKPAYMHSFANTRRYTVLVEFPFVVDPLSIRFSNDTIAESYVWKPERGTRFTVLDRRRGEVVSEPVAEPFFAFHHVNAYAVGDDEIVMDICAYEDASVVDEFYLDEIRHEPPLDLPGAELRRYSLSLADGTVESETLYDGHIELPRVRDELDGKKHRYVYGVGNETNPPCDMPNALVKFDTEDGEATVRDGDGYPSEPVFVPEPDGESEDEGVVLTVVLEPDEGSSSLLVLDAEDMSEVVRVDVGRPVPFGFHGDFWGS